MTTIEWTDATWNPIVGCSRVSKGCEHCYAERVAHRGMSAQHRGLTVLGKKGPRWTGEVRFLPEKLDEPLRWRKPRRVFVNSMSDLFHEGVSNEEIAAIFGVMAAAPQHTFQVLTKRPERAQAWFEWVRGRERDGRSVFPDDDPAWRIGQMLAVTLRRLAGIDGQRPGTRATGWEDFDPRRQPWPLPNVWLGVSVENQEWADRRWAALSQIPARVRFISYEPAIDGLTMRDWPTVPDWLIIGGESGRDARIFDASWARALIAECRERRCAPFVKQLGAVALDSDWYGFAPLPLTDSRGGDPSEWPEDLRVREWPEMRHG